VSRPVKRWLACWLAAAVVLRQLTHTLMKKKKKKKKKKNGMHCAFLSLT